MKGIHGLIVAFALGLAGAAANFFYLNAEAQKQDMVAFIGIKKGAIVARGERLTDDNMVKVEIPANHIGNLKEYAYLWADRIAVKDMPVWRTLDSSSEGGLLLLQSDLRTPPPELNLGKGERAEFIAVPRNFDTSHLNPGDKISFRVTTLAPPGPTPAPRPTAADGSSTAAGSADLQPKPEEQEAAPQGIGPSEIIGPFVIVSVGNRLGTLEVMKAAKIAPVQQNLLMIRISPNVPGETERFDKLATCINRFGPNCYTIRLHGKE